MYQNNIVNLYVLLIHISGRKIHFSNFQSNYEVLTSSQLYDKLKNKKKLIKEIISFSLDF